MTSRKDKVLGFYIVRWPMRGLLDYIFDNLEEKDLDRARIVKYIRYWDELIRNGLPIEKELEYQAIKLSLLRRMNRLNQQQLKFFSQDKEDKQSES